MTLSVKLYIIAITVQYVLTLEVSRVLAVCQNQTNILETMYRNFFEFI